MWEELAELSLVEFDMVFGRRLQCNPLSIKERLGAESYTRSRYEFSDLISLHELMDIPLEGDLYTWPNSPSASRNNRFLFSLILADYFTHFSQKQLPRVLSNHFQILLEVGSQHRG